MRRSVLAATTALLLLAWPAHAQLFPSNPSPAAPSDQPPPSVERVLLDTTLYVNPPKTEGLCITTDPGVITVTVKRTNVPVTLKPAAFQLSGLMADMDANINLPISDVEATATTRVNGAWFYCWSVKVTAPETEGMSNAERGAYVQRIAVKITLTP